MVLVHFLTEAELSEILPGTWRIAATNVPLWLTGGNVQPQYTYSLVSASPLTLNDEVSYVTTEGERKQIVGRDRLRRDEFTWRGRGARAMLGTRWHVSGGDAERTLLVIRTSHSFARPAGIDVVIREGSSYPSLRRVVAGSTEELGLSPEDFATLGWLGI